MDNNSVRLSTRHQLLSTPPSTPQHHEPLWSSLCLWYDYAQRQLEAEQTDAFVVTRARETCRAITHLPAASTNFQPSLPSAHRHRRLYASRSEALSPQDQQLALAQQIHQQHQQHCCCFSLCRLGEATAASPGTRRSDAEAKEERAT